MTAVRQWHVYLAGREFTIKSDHNPLVYLRNTKNPKGKIARWLTELEDYQYSIEYIPGKSNQKADALSRNRDALLYPENIEFENKVYKIEISDFYEKIKEEQKKDFAISYALKQIADEGLAKKGCFKKIKNQLRVQDDLLTKSGRVIIPRTLRKYLTQIYHDSLSHVIRNYTK